VTAFVDTSALYAVLNSADANHERAAACLRNLREANEVLITSNYVLVETMALLGRRVGFQAVQVFQTDVTPILRTHWVDESLHQQAASALLAGGTRDLSFVDCVSFEVMRSLGVTTAFVFDRHFIQQGFDCIPE
jgi:predicted nucleic acid-binding protein